jgi:prepilin-type N-terminal cleavage/methylation domain-containing protein
MQSSRTPAARQWSRSPGRSQEDALRLAFTLLELLIAISIIAVMATLILTVASSASRTAHNAQVSADILSLSAGISAFKQRFGVEPPSSITLYEQASGWTNSSDPNAARSMSLIRQIWPQFDFTYANETSNAIDINGNGTTNDSITISGSECLVFFLFGMPTLNSPTATGGAPMGFSQNPVDPFNRSGGNRLSFGEFDKTRLILYTPSGGTQHTMNAYLDPLSGQTQPYLYLSSYGGQGYNISELVGSTPSTSNAPGGTFIDVYRQGQQGYWSPTTASASLPATAPYPSPYQPESGQTISTSPNTSPSPALNPNSYQIISPGGDRLYGVGGEYESASANALLVIYPASGTTSPVDRTGERDNITNFSPGTLAP